MDTKKRNTPLSAFFTGLVLHQNNVVGVLVLIMLGFLNVSAYAKANASVNARLYGTLHVFTGKVQGVSGVNLNSYSSRIGYKGVNTLNRGWVVSHKLELELNTFNEAFSGGGVRKIAPGLKADKNDNGKLDLRNAWFGLRGSNGEFRIGRHTPLYDIVDDGQNLLSKLGLALTTSGHRNEQVLYVNKAAHIGYALSYALFESDSKDRIFSGLLNYAKGPWYLGLGLEKASGLSGGVKLSLGYSEDKLSLGLVHDKQMGTSGRSITTFGQYKFGKPYLGIEYGKVFNAEILDQHDAVLYQNNTISRAFELGYQWKKGLKTYLDYSHLGERKETTIAIKYDF